MRRLPSILLLSLFTTLACFFLLIYLRFRPYFPFAKYLLGVNQPTSYLVLLGNDTEMRANGGFVGSYAKIIMNFPHYDVSFQDIYVPDGQLQGYVTPPAPIQEAFQHGTWQLSNADWEPDFATSASALRWFFDKGGEINPDNLVLVNLTTIKKALNIIGDITVPEYQASLTPDNLYLFLQGKAEVDFFPGSTQKKDALTAVGHALVKKLPQLSFYQQISLLKIVYSDLRDQNILINSTNPDFQALLEKENFAGRLSSNTPDTYLLVEENLGANKANAYVTRQTQHSISFTADKTFHQAIITFTNNSPESNPNPPFHYGGDYKTYLRFYLPSDASDIKIASSSDTIIASTSPRYGLTELGFWLVTPAQGQSVITLSYTLPVTSKDYALNILKQHGLVSSPQTINLAGKNFSTQLSQDYFLPYK